MNISNLDWGIIIATLLVSLIIGLLVAKKSGKNSTEYFLSGRSMPWWMLGISMVATTFSADTPNLVTDIIRKNGVAGNWVWWAFLLTGMLTVFVYAKLWRRAGIFTDLEFYELRYSGRAAKFLRGFRAIYLGVFFNVMIMATVFLAGIKIGSVMLGLTPIQTLLICSLITVGYTVAGGLRAVIFTDLFQFILAMIGTIWAAYYIVNLPEIGGLGQLLEHSSVIDKKQFIPDFSQTETLIPLIIIPIAVQWWSVWYPGAEPGGGGYVAQRMLSAKDENHAVGATLLFNFAHYALRPWPWILIGLASLIVFPDLESIQTAFPEVSSSLINDDLAYPAMLTYLPMGLIGLVIGSLLAALMSTISTHLNWGASYVVHDFYARFSKNQVSEKRKVFVGRLATIVLLILSALVALMLSNALQAFNILLQIGAGTGLLFILRWFWWRINAWSEVTAMVVSFMVALIFETSYFDGIEGHWKLVYGVLFTTTVWIGVTLLTSPERKETLIRFCEKIKPYDYGWRKVWISPDQGHSNSLGKDIANMMLGTMLIYSALFSTGFLLYSQWTGFFISSMIVVLTAWGLWVGLLQVRKK